MAPQLAGLYAISLGLSGVFEKDHELLQHGLMIHDALYAWCQHGQDETHRRLPAV
ncbi:chromate resistance protein ChrB domain-containing protein [Rhodanobacter sp. FW106-PBR-R2A-1-13]|uniref:chromate resistance protein ChrB domain-containing protein n=1 Tax=Rhodanobacter sp. FW106-PBR-R2A-1-13 TaxID=3454845 RepID=UPI0034E500EB